MTGQAFDTVDVLRLEIEGDPTGLTNLIKNPSGELGSWGWITPVAGTAFGPSVFNPALQFQTTPAQAAYWTTEFLPVAAGEYAAGRWECLGTVANGSVKVRFEWYDSGFNLLSSSPQSADQAGAGVKLYAAQQAPAGTAYARLRFDFYVTGGNPTAGAWYAFHEATVAKAATAAELGSQRRNLVPNPSFETDTKGWAPAAGATIARSTAQAYAGAASLAATATVADGLYFGTPAGTSGIPVVGGADYTWQLRTRPDSVARFILAYCYWYDATGASLGSDSVGGWNVTGAWTRLSATFTAKPGAAYARIYVRAIGAAVGETHYFDAFMLERATSALDYFDGSTPDTGETVYDWATGSPTVTTRINLVPNPSFEVNTTGWEPGHVWSATLSRSTTNFRAGTACLRFGSTASSSGAGVSTLSGKAGIPVAPGLRYFLRFSIFLGTGYGTHNQVLYRVAFYDSAGAYINTGSAEGDFVAAATDVATDTWYDYLGSTWTTAPDGAAYARIEVATRRTDGTLATNTGALLDRVSLIADSGEYFDGSTPDGTVDFGTVDRAWTGTAHASASTETTTITLPYSTATTSTLAYIEPVEYLDVLADSHEIRTTREELNVGELKATVLSSALDPAQSTVIRPGKAMRLTALVGGSWQPIFTGALVEAGVTYELKDPKVPESRRARIEVTAMDAAQRLTNAKRPEGVATIAELPYVLEGAGVPWSVNGSGNQVPTAAVTTYNDNATALDQVALTRDTELAYAWMSRAGVLTVADAAHLPTVPVVLDEGDYSNLDVSFSTKDCINEVTVIVQSVGTGGETTETTYGPYTDPESIAEWGRFAKTFTVTGLDSTEADALAAAILAANGTPRVRVNSVTLPLSTLARVDAQALLELYTLVNIVNVARGIDDQLRVTGIEHAIQTDKWLMTLTFSDEGGVAQPTFQPPVQSGARPDVGVIELFAGSTPPPGKLLCNGASYAKADYPHLFAVIGYTYGGSGDFFNVPNLTDRFPIGSGTKALGTTGGSATHSHTLSSNGHAKIGWTAAGQVFLRRLTSGIASWAANVQSGATAVPLSASTAAQTIGVELGGTTDASSADALNPWLSVNYVIRAV